MILKDLMTDCLSGILTFLKNRPLPAKRFYFPFLLSGILYLFSCQQFNSYHDNKTFENSVWNQDSLVIFTITIEDTINYFDFYLNLRHTTSYNFSNIYFFIETGFPDNKFARDTVEFILADKRGEWYGKGFGQIKDYSVLLRPGIRFPMTGTYTFIFEQAMRNEELEGIKDIGISMIKQ